MTVQLRSDDEKGEASSLLEDESKIIAEREQYKIVSAKGVESVAGIDSGEKAHIKGQIETAADAAAGLEAEQPGVLLPALRIQQDKASAGGPVQSRRSLR